MKLHWNRHWDLFSSAISNKRISKIKFLQGPISITTSQWRELQRSESRHILCSVRFNHEKQVEMFTRFILWMIIFWSFWEPAEHCSENSRFKATCRDGTCRNRGGFTWHLVDKSHTKIHSARGTSHSDLVSGDEEMLLQIFQGTVCVHKQMGWI